MTKKAPKHVVFGRKADKLIMGVYAKKHLTIYEQKIPKRTKQRKTEIA